MQLDLSQLISAITENSAGLDSAASQISSIYGELRQLGDNKVDNIRKTGESEIIVKDAELNGKLQAQQNARDAAAAMGSNMDDSSEIITALGVQMRQNFEAGNAALDTINAKQSVGLFDNPIEFLMNQVTVGQDYDTYNYHAQKYNLAAKTMSDLNALTTSTAQKENAIAATMNAGSVSANLEAMRLRTEILADDAKVESLARGGEEIRLLTTLRGQQLDNLMKVKSIQNEERNWNLRLQEFNRQSKVYEQQFAEKELQEQDEIAITNTINAARKFYNLPPIEAREVKRLRSLGGDVAKQLQEQYITGASMLSSGTPIIASDPGTAAEILINSKAPMTPEFAPVRDFLKNTYNSVRQGLPGSTIDTTDPKEVRSGAAKYATQVASGMKLELREGDSANIYSLPPASTISATGVIKDSTLFKSVLAPVLTASPKEDISPKRVLSLTTEAIRAGQIPLEVAARDLQNYFSVAKEINNATRKYEAAGLPPQDKVNIRVDMGAQEKVVDITDPVQIKKILIIESSGLRKLVGSNLGF